MECIVCGNNLHGRRKEFCSDRCRMVMRRGSQTRTEPEQGVKVEQKSNRDNLTFMGRSVKELDQYFKLGNEVFCEVLGCRHTFHSSELPYWMLDGHIEGKLGGRIGDVILTSEEKRVVFRELMYSYDVRYVR